MFENLTIRRGPIYDPASVQPMRDELTFVGFEELKTPEDVAAAITETSGSMLVMVNSVCGCAAGAARPGATLALQHAKIPDRFVTVFAGMERDAVDAMRAHFGNYPPSSPCMALFRDGQLVYMMQRFDIEGHSAQEVAAELCRVFDTVCTRTGPSVPAEKYAQLEHARMCGSEIPRFGT